MTHGRVRIVTGDMHKHRYERGLPKSGKNLSNGPAASKTSFVVYEGVRLA